MNDEPRTPGGADDPSAPQDPYGQQSPYGQQGPYGQPQQPPYGQAPYGQAPYGQPNPYPAAPKPPVPSSATTSMVLGILALGSVVVACGIGLLAAPFAWVIGGRALREIDASHGRLGGRDQAQAGRVMGIIGTILLVLVLLIALLLVLFFVGGATIDGTTTYNEF